MRNEDITRVLLFFSFSIRSTFSRCYSKPYLYDITLLLRENTSEETHDTQAKTFLLCVRLGLQCFIFIWNVSRSRTSKINMTNTRHWMSMLQANFDTVILRPYLFHAHTHSSPNLNRFLISVTTIRCMCDWCWDCFDLTLRPHTNFATSIVQCHLHGL